MADPPWPRRGVLMYLTLKVLHLTMNKLQTDMLFFIIITIISLSLVSKIVERKFEPQISDYCKELGYCEFVLNYPVDLVAAKIEELGDKITLQEDFVYNDTTTRRSGKIEEVGLCAISEKQILTPEALQDKDNKWHIILNKPTGPLQSFSVEICARPTYNSGVQSCLPHVSTQVGYSNYCKQKFIYRRVATLTSGFDDPMKMLKLPSCCSCIITVDSNIYD